MPTFHSVPRPGETAQAHFLREYVVRRIAWSLLGLAAWGATILFGCGVWAIYQEAQRYRADNQLPTVASPVERAKPLPPGWTGRAHYSLDGYIYRGDELWSLQKEFEREQMRGLRWSRHKCKLDDGCYNPDILSETTLNALCLIGVCIDLGLLGLTLWLLWGAVTGRCFSPL